MCRHRRKLGKPMRELKAFAKTKGAGSGEKQEMTLHIPVKILLHMMIPV